jgi:hypothetical protein
LGPLGVDFIKLFCQAKNLPTHKKFANAQKIFSSFSPAIKIPNFKLKLVHFLPNLFVVCQASFTKKLLILLAQKSSEKMLVQLTQGPSLSLSCGRL